MNVLEALDRLCVEGWTIIPDVLTALEIERARALPHPNPSQLFDLVSPAKVPTTLPYDGALRPIVQRVLSCIRGGSAALLPRQQPELLDHAGWHVDALVVGDMTVSTLIALDDFTSETGTELAVGTHVKGWRNSRTWRAALAAVPHRNPMRAIALMPRIQIKLRSGSALMFLGSHLIHRRGAARGQTRRAVNLQHFGDRAACVPEPDPDRGLVGGTFAATAAR